MTRQRTAQRLVGPRARDSQRVLMSHLAHHAQHFCERVLNACWPSPCVLSSCHHQPPTQQHAAVEERAPRHFARSQPRPPDAVAGVSVAHEQRLHRAGAQLCRGLSPPLSTAPAALRRTLTLRRAASAVPHHLAARARAACRLGGLLPRYRARGAFQSANPAASPCCAAAPPAGLTRCALAAQKFAAHRDEFDPERVRLILERSAADVAWVVAKYSRK